MTDWSKAVSYTHLDVYKRQADASGLGVAVVRLPQFLAFIGLALHSRPHAAHGVVPVSYTHLDVYKRQIFWVGMSFTRMMQHLSSILPCVSAQQLTKILKG